jgi:hypothetical protein
VGSILDDDTGETTVESARDRDTDAVSPPVKTYLVLHCQIVFLSIPISLLDIIVPSPSHQQHDQHCRHLQQQQEEHVRLDGYIIIGITGSY